MREPHFSNDGHLLRKSDFAFISWTSVERPGPILMNFWSNKICNIPYKAADAEKKRIVVVWVMMITNVVKDLAAKTQFKLQIMIQVLKSWSWLHLPAHLLICPLICPLFCLFSSLFDHSPAHLLIGQLICSLSHLFANLLMHSFVYKLACSFSHLLFHFPTCLLIYSLNCSFAHSIICPLVCSYAQFTACSSAYLLGYFLACSYICWHYEQAKGQMSKQRGKWEKK